MGDIKTTLQKLADNVSPFIKEKYNINKAYNDLVETTKYISVVCKQYEEQLEKHSELCRLINAIADLSSSKVARVLDDTIKEIAYASPEPEFEVRKMYLSEAIRDLLSGMDETDVVLKYDDILYRYNGGR